MANPSTGSTANPLDQLRDIHLPEPVSWWPLAPGWWILIIGGCLLSAWLIQFLYRRYRANRYRRQALQQLKQLQLTSSAQQQLRKLFELLKQTANSAYPNRHPGSKSIELFIYFLQNSCEKSVFENLDLQLDKALYSNSEPTSSNSEQLFEDARIWMKEHKAAHQLKPGKLELGKLEPEKPERYKPC